MLDLFFQGNVGDKEKFKEGEVNEENNEESKIVKGILIKIFFIFIEVLKFYCQIVKLYMCY